MSSRRPLHDWLPLYLFSVDLELSSYITRIGKTGQGFRMVLRATPGSSRVYHVARARSVTGREATAISGRLEFSQEDLDVRPDDVGESEVRSTVFTDDGAIIHLTLNTVANLQRGLAQRLLTPVRRDQLGTEGSPFVAPLFMTVRFEVCDPSLDWLNGCQGVAFGQLVVIRSEARRCTYDVYALS